jgi:hypothetical protein
LKTRVSKSESDFLHRADGTKGGAFRAAYWRSSGNGDKYRTYGADG